MKFFAYVCIVDLNTGGNHYRIHRVTVSDAGVYECFVDNGVKPTTLAKMRVDVLCKCLLLQHNFQPAEFVKKLCN